MAHVSITVNGKVRSADVEPRLLLVHFLREHLNLTGTHVGCDTSQCGACTVLIDGRSAKSCTVFAVQADGCDGHHHRGAREGRPAAPAAGRLLGRARPAVRLLHAGHDHVGGQPAAATTRTPTEQQIREGISGNFCRCTGYQHIVNAIQRAAGKMAVAPEVRK